MFTSLTSAPIFLPGVCNAVQRVALTHGTPATVSYLCKPAGLSSKSKLLKSTWFGCAHASEGHRPCSAGHAGCLLGQSVTAVPTVIEVIDLVWCMSAFLLELTDKLQKSNTGSGYRN